MLDAILASSLFLLPLILPQLVAADVPYTYSSYSSSLSRSKSAGQPSSKWICPGRPRSGEAPVYSELHDLAFFTNFTFGGQEVSLIIDTGSSDVWIADSSFTCLNVTTNEPIAQEDCYLVATYMPGSTFEEIPDVHMNITYADGTHLTGIYGYETVGIAGIEVSRQQIAVPYLAAWYGDNITSGLAGLAYPFTTREWIGTDPSTDNRSDPSTFTHYSSIINTIFNVEDLTEPVFSLSLSRNPSLVGFGGYITIGGIPDISDPTINATDNFAVVPIELFTPRSPTNFTFYAISVDELVYPGSPGRNTTQYIVDSGTTLIYLPTEDTEAINAAYDPPAVYSDDFGAYIIPCNATPPEVGITIGGQVFYLNPADLVFDAEIGDGTCLSSVLDGFDVFLLGDPFLKNVLAVFDVGNSQMGFSSRMYYASEDSL